MSDRGVLFGRDTLMIMPEVNRAWLRERLKNSIQLLACPADVQLGHFPHFVRAPDELALEFDDCLEAFVSNCRAEITDEQLSCLDSIDRSLSQMPKEQFRSEAVTDSPEWHRVRRLAADALRAFNWPSEVPPRRDDKFVPG
jgi:hypothetical protein